MHTNRIARALTLALIAGIAGWFFYRQRAAVPASDNTAESAVWRMLDASRLGLADTALECYTGEMEQVLRRTLQEMGPARFRDYLVSNYQQVKGIAMSPPQMSAPDEARIAVEYVYQDRNEVQQVHVRRIGKQWKIFRVDTAERN